MSSSGELPGSGTSEAAEQRSTTGGTTLLHFPAIANGSPHRAGDLCHLSLCPWVAETEHQPRPAPNRDGWTVDQLDPGHNQETDDDPWDSRITHWSLES